MSSGSLATAAIPSCIYCSGPLRYEFQVGQVFVFERTIQFTGFCKGRYIVEIHVLWFSFLQYIMLKENSPTLCRKNLPPLRKGKGVIYLPIRAVLVECHLGPWTLELQIRVHKLVKECHLGPNCWKSPTCQYESPLTSHISNHRGFLGTLGLVDTFEKSGTQICILKDYGRAWHSMKSFKDWPCISLILLLIFTIHDLASCLVLLISMHILTVCNRLANHSISR